ncbi:hypothetical protein BRR55_06280 [Salmonella enterica]|nr:hypothetical protein [Salmonella enterica]
MLSVIFSLPAEASVSRPELHQQAQQKALQEQLVPEVPDIRLTPAETVEKSHLFLLRIHPVLISLILIFRDEKIFLTGFLSHYLHNRHLTGAWG